MVRLHGFNQSIMDSGSANGYIRTHLPNPSLHKPSAHNLLTQNRERTHGRSEESYELCRKTEFHPRTYYSRMKKTVAEYANRLVKKCKEG